MKKIKLRLVLLGLIILIHSCTSDKKAVEDDEFGTDSAEVSTSADGSEVDPDLALDDTTKSPSETDQASAPSAGDEFAEFDKATNGDAAPSQTASTEDTLEKELNSLDEAPAQAPPVAINEAPTIPIEKTAQPEGELTLEDQPATTPSDMSKSSTPEVAVINPEAPLEIASEAPVPAPIVQVPDINPQVSPSIEQPPIPMASKVSEINSVQYQSNQSGGTVVINSNEPLQFTTRSNPATHQIIIEVQNSVIPKKLKRSLNTKDMASSIGSVDIYQKPNSNVARFVVQLRPGSPEPLVQPEGTSLLIVGAANPTYVKHNEANSQNSNRESSSPTNQSVSAIESTQNGIGVPHSSQEVNPDLTSEGIMNSQTLEDFLASNNKFYGKKISIEAVKLNVNDAFKFLAEESGVNMIIDDGVSGDVTLKLRQVPWDQAFVLILKSKKLGYKRQGNVIRIAEIANLQKEEDDAIKLSEARKNIQPLLVKRFFIGYAEIGEMEKKIKDFISNTQLTATGAIATSQSRGKVISDARTSSLIVTETAENLLKIEKLVAALDTQPKQVLIEGKVVEAKETYSHSLGVTWGTDLSSPAPAGNAIRPSVSFDPKIGSSIFNPRVGIGIPGQPGDFGNLNASLSLGESENKLRVLSSPRISVLSSQSATISQTVNVMIEKSSSVGAGTGIITSTKEAVPVGVTLTVTPQVSNEGTVVMDLSIERSFLAGSSGTDIEKRNAKTKVIVRSGQTAVIGGIFQADSAEDVSGIPFFKDIPIFGVLFKGTSKNRTKNELVIFVTPRIQKTVMGDTSTVTKFE